MTFYLEVDNLSCQHRKVLITAKDFRFTTELRSPGDSPLVVCIECKRYEIINFKPR